MSIFRYILSASLGALALGAAGGLAWEWVQPDPDI